MDKCVILCPENMLDSSQIKQVVESTYNIELTFLPQKSLTIPDEIIVISFELAKNIVYNTSYDLIKFTIQSLLKNLKFDKKKTEIIVEKNGRRSRIVLSYELTEEQKQQYVDASIQMLLK